MDSLPQLTLDEIKRESAKELLDVTEVLNNLVYSIIADNLNAEDLSDLINRLDREASKLMLLRSTVNKAIDNLGSHEKRDLDTLYQNVYKAVLKNSKK